MTPMMCMAVAIFFEARNQEYDGMLAVGEVIQQRVESSRYPDNACDVVNQRKQFSYTHDGMSDDPLKYDTHFDRLAWVTAQEAATEIMEGPTAFASGATHYHATNVSPYWTASFELVGQIGDHVFYIEK